MSLKRLSGVLMSTAVASLAVCLVLEWQTVLRLAAENKALLRQLDARSALLAENQQWSNRLAQASSPDRLPPAEFTELLRLRGESAMLRSQEPELRSAHTENDQIHVSLSNYLATTTEGNAHPSTNYWPQNSWTNAGYGSPEAALQTLFWAANNGDASNFMASIAPDGLKEAGSDLTNKSASEVSAAIANDTYDLKSVHLLGEEFPDQNTVLLKLEIEGPNGPDTITFAMKQVGGQWLFGGPRQ